MKMTPAKMKMGYPKMKMRGVFTVVHRPRKNCVKGGVMLFSIMVNAVKFFTLRLCISAYYIHFKRVKVKIFTAFTIKRFKTDVSGKFRRTRRRMQES